LLTNQPTKKKETAILETATILFEEHDETGDHTVLRSGTTYAIIGPRSIILHRDGKVFVISHDDFAAIAKGYEQFTQKKGPLQK
jgi:hypothetical protein